MRTGNLRDNETSSGSAGDTTYEAEFVSGAPYSSFVDLGTAPHVIVPVNAKVLHFTVGGTEVFATKVNHPGTSPANFFEEPMPDRFANALNESLHAVPLGNG